MGNELRINSTNIAAQKELLSSAYDVAHNVPPETSIWEDHFSPMALGLGMVIPMIASAKEFKCVKMDNTLTKPELYNHKYRMIRTNELDAYLDRLKIKKTIVNGKKVADPFLNSELLNLKHQISQVQNSGKVSKDLLTELNKKYYTLLDKNTTWKSPITKGLSKISKFAPNTMGEFLKAFKHNKLLLLFELFQEGESVIGAFSHKEGNKLNTGLNIEEGTKQLVKSAGRVAVGYSGYAAGIALGAKIGAIAGSVIPFAGTFLGGVIGSAIGFAVGGVVSQLSRKAYNAIIPDYQTIQKEKTINAMVDTTDKSSEADELIIAEYNQVKSTLSEAIKMAKEAEQSGYEDKESLAKIEELSKNAQVIEDIYRQKFNKELAQASTTETSEEKTSVQKNQLSQAPQQAQNVAPIQTNPFLQNQMLMGASAQTDWSSMLTPDVQKRLFYAA